jgi:hypothetical protein
MGSTIEHRRAEAGGAWRRFWAALLQALAAWPV